MKVAYKPKGLSPNRPPNWRDERAARIAAQQAEREAKIAAKLAERAAPAPPRPAAPAAEPAPKAPPRGAGKQSAITTRATLQKQRGAIERAMAWLVLLVSFLGSIVALHGGWPPFIASLTVGPLNLGALLGGVLIQLVLTFLEWYYSDRWPIAWGARIVDTATTAIGYGPLFLAPLMAMLHDRGLADPTLAAWGIISLVSLGVAWFPESRLVD